MQELIQPDLIQTQQAQQAQAAKPAEPVVMSDAGQPAQPVEPPPPEEEPSRYVRITLPNSDEMELVGHEGRTFFLRPLYYGGDCTGLSLALVTAFENGGQEVESSYRVRIRRNGEVRLLKAEK